MIRPKSKGRDDRQRIFKKKQKKGYVMLFLGVALLLACTFPYALSILNIDRSLEHSPKVFERLDAAPKIVTIESSTARHGHRRPIVTTTLRSPVPFRRGREMNGCGLSLENEINCDLEEVSKYQKQYGDSRYLIDKSRRDDVEILPYGKVMSEFARRVLSRHIAQSDVLVFSTSNSSVPYNLMKRAREEHHTTHLVGKSDSTSKQTFIDEWWRRLSNKQPKWLLLTVLEDGGKSTIFSSRAAGADFLKNGPTMTYIVLGITASITDISKNHSNYSFTGMDTVELLLEHNYKVQLLSASDSWDTGGNILKGSNPRSFTIFQPNDLITKENIETFFKWGAKAAIISKGLAGGRNWAQDDDNAVFKAYLFATQGLDLAIPSRRQYLSETKFTNAKWRFPYANVSAERRAMVERVQFVSCPVERHSSLNLDFLKHSASSDKDDILSSIRVKCNNEDVTSDLRNKDKSYELWTNNDNQQVTSSSRLESACIKVNCNDILRVSTKSDKKDFQVSCATRIVPDKALLAKQKLSASAKAPNILMVLIDPISRPQFDIAMPRTKTLLSQQLNFPYFQNYATVGNNSGPNQAALYAGHNLKSHDGIRHQKGTWIWDSLSSLGYATFKAEDGCIANSNMVQSIQPNTTHGQALHKLYCFDFARPNCVGKQLAAEYLFEHAKDFVQTYSAAAVPWAAFLSLVDTHEDTMTLGSIVDQYLEKFLHGINNDLENGKNTLIIVLSDHGLHYGPYFQSRDGEKERSQPLLYMKIPDTLPRLSHDNLIINTRKWVTPFDVHETLLDIVGIPREASVGSSLLKELPATRAFCHGVSSIPDTHCDLLDSSLEKQIMKREILRPPSLSSFYADIRKDHRLNQAKCYSGTYTTQDIFRLSKRWNKRCRCSTNKRDWFQCNHHPWNDNQGEPNEFFLFVTCDESPLHLDIRVKKNEQRALELRQVRSRSNRESKPPNILIIEIDSVSVEYADRHLPQTRQLLKKYRATGTTDVNGCHEGLCGVDFSKFAVVGPNSIANQVAGLSGCLTTLLHYSCFTKKENIGDVCGDPNLLEYGMRLRNIGPDLHTVYCTANSSTPWLYDVAKDEGYITFFGEEFCFPGSPWVVQENIFPIAADIELHTVFCRLVKHMKPWLDDRLLYNAGYGHYCINEKEGIPKQEIALEVLRQMWHQYNDEPKFAYLNGMAAHNYVKETEKLAWRAEEYDEALSRFLKSILGRDDAHETIIIIRSDHGLQGGDSSVVDYSTQIEHSHPFTEIIIPDQYPVKNLIANSDQVVTPFDMYAMLRRLMTGKMDMNRLDGTYDILHEIIPSRTCRAAKIPEDFCTTEYTPSPNFGTCNMFEAKQAVFCSDPHLGTSKLYLRRTQKINAEPLNSQQSSAKHIRPAFMATKNENTMTIPCASQAELMSSPLHKNLEQQWSMLDKIVEEHQEGRLKVSGGIFLYPRQSYILISIIRRLVSNLTNGQERLRICETGFGAGHSAALFLAASTKVEVVTFDKFDRAYQMPAFHSLQSSFGDDRIKSVAGDTCKTVPGFFSRTEEPRCDFVHGSSFCSSDLLDLTKATKPNGVITATAMENLFDKSVYFGHDGQWRNLRFEGCVARTTCWKEEKKELEKSYVFAKKGITMEHHFCIGLSTGQCSYHKAAFTNNTLMLNFDDQCSGLGRVDVPV